MAERHTITEADEWGCRLYLLIVKYSGKVLRCKVQNKFNTTGRSFSDPDVLAEIERLKERGIINKAQYTKIYPGPGETSSYEDYDVTLLVALYRAIFTPRNPVWVRNHDPVANDFLVEADIVRIRNLRNKVLHQTTFSETTFNDLWTQTAEVLVRLGSVHFPDLSIEIDNLKTETIDTRVKPKLYEEMMQWKLMEELMERLGLVNETIMKHSPSVNALERSKAEISDVLEEEYFVKTDMFKRAEDMLERDGVIVIKGAQGEGKTTIAKKLVKNKDKCLKINNITDYDMYSEETVETVLIDDMFGCTMFDKNESRKWPKILVPIMKSVSEKKVKLIITSRSYILDDAQRKLYISHQIKESNTLEISSKELSIEEKKDIVKNHMAMNNREINETLIGECVDQSNKPSSFVIGFPECARLFCAETRFFKKKGEFFETPMTHIKACLESFFKEDHTFLAFFVLWAQSSHKICLLDLEKRPDKTPDAIRYPIEHLGYTCHDTLKNVRNILSITKDFIHYDVNTETCQFQHQVLGDAVGLVAFQRNKSAVLEYCHKSFIERYVSIDKTNDNQNESIIVVPARFEQLCSRIGHLICPQNGGNNDDQYLDCTLLLHQVFVDKDFCNKFIKTMREQNMLHIFRKSVATVQTNFKVTGVLKVIDKETYTTEIGILSYALNNSLLPFANACYSDKMQKDETFKKRFETDLKMSMLLAVSEGNEDKIKDLEKIKKDQTFDSNIILAAIKKANVKVLDQLLDISKMSINQYTREGKSPLMIFVEERDFSAVECILKCEHFGDTDINYQNENDEKKTALHIACAQGNADIVQMLLEKNPNLQIRDCNQECPIHAAALNRKTDIVKLLLNHNTKQADYTLDYKGEQRMSLYHIAVRKKDIRLLNMLLERKLPVTCINGRNQTPLALAVQNQNFEMANVLVGISIEQNAHTIQDNEGQTTLHKATEYVLALPNDDKYLHDWYGFLKQLSQSETGTVSDKSLLKVQTAIQYHQEKLDRLNELMEQLN